VAGSKKSQDAGGEARRRVLEAAPTLFAAQCFTLAGSQAEKKAADLDSDGNLCYDGRQIAEARQEAGREPSWSESNEKQPNGR
jgi:hypothetical protein